MAYPELISADMLPRYAHITDDVVRTDIADTLAEISGLEATMNAERVVSETHPDVRQRRLADFRAGARVLQIAERKAFVAFLRRLLDARGVPL